MAGRFVRSAWIVVLVAGVALTGCTGGLHRVALPTTGRNAAPHEEHAGSRSRSGATEFRPLVGGATDGEAQYIHSFAEADGGVVAVGGNHSGGVWKPLFLHSGDDGRTWQPGSVVAGGGGMTVADTAEIVVARHGSFLALGEASGGVSAWSSTDGRRWVRHAVSSAVMGPGVAVGALGVTAGGYVAVGETTTPGRRAAPIAWTSADGIRWVRHSGSSAGLGAVAGSDLDMSGVAASADGRRLVAVGSVESHDGARDRPAVWQSTAAGTTWRRVALPVDLAGAGTRSWFADVRWLGGRFVAVGTGGSEHSGRYAGVVAESADGSHWQASSRGRGLTTGAQVYLQSVVSTRGELSAYGTVCERACRIYGVAGSSKAWHPVALPTSGEGQRMQVLGAFTTATGTLLLAGAANPGSDDDARVWRAGPGQPVSRVDLPAVRAATRPTVDVHAIAEAGGVYRAVGSAGGRAVVWTSSDGRRFGAPAALSNDPAVFASAITHGPSGWLISGGETIGEQDQALVWTSLDGVTWSRSAAGVFGRAGTFSYSDIDAAAPFRGWVVVGESSDDGSPHASALAYRSADGHTWHAGDSTTRQMLRVSPTRWDAQYDLRGGISGRRSMADVATVGPGLIAVGTAQHRTAATTDSPAWWTSTDGRTWRLHWLPLPTGAASAYPSRVTAVGRTVVVAGTETHATVTRACVWTSRDGGRTWRARVLAGIGGAGADVDAAVLGSFTHGFVLAGSAGSPGQSVPLMQTSSDGAVWHRVRLTDPRFADRGDWAINGAVVHSGALIGVAARTSPAGVETFTFTQPL